jgi:ABC-2 type transport system ATP-binding protein
MRLMPTCIQLEKLTKCYGKTVAVGGLSFEVETGEVLGLLGPNGAGKSTTLYMLTGLVRPTAGSVSLFGRDLHNHFLDIAQRMGVLVERPSFYEHLSARRNLMIFAQLAGREVNIDRALDRVDLLRAGDGKVRGFSQGMRQRLGLAQALLTEPELLILDEPTSGLDIEATQEVLALLRQLAEEAKVTIVFSSHLLHEVETLCDRVAVLNEGNLVACEAMDALLSYDESRVDVLVDAPDAVAKRLGEQDWVTGVSSYPGRVHVRLDGVSVNHLTAFLVNNGYKLAGVIPKRRTLRDYFLEVLQK